LSYDSGRLQTMKLSGRSRLDDEIVTSDIEVDKLVEGFQPSDSLKDTTLGSYL
jgi:hypothetical protein